ncbi:hypothetical protein Agub_g8126 [Astrephomene gubernaculifera]|uniref:Glycosyl transferase CAP10 domain-containing protein n=1 Tax=Astrephomene gubernaculifera TaxID=47775 RepID=A0AAD3HN80_9CHLO|nr:hypothetical protein Agub_g8126 [Astrephomene gubernaculifera]
MIYVVVALLVWGAQQTLAYDCSAHPWIDEAVQQWFRPSYEVARQSSKTIEESLQAIADIKWGNYSTGKTLVVLWYDASTSEYRLRFEELHKHNEAHKPVGMQRVLERAVRQHNADLVAALGKREMKFIFGTEDFPIVDPNMRLRVPSFQPCTTKGSVDVPVPDHSFELYSQASYTNHSWWEVRRLLLLKAALLPWSHRQRELFVRGDAGVGYRKTLLSILHEARVNGSDLSLFGVHVNAHSTGFYVSNRKHFTFLDNWCQYRYLLHPSGLTYSISLKYKLACGAVVLYFDHKYSEFYYPALKPGVHLLSFPEAPREQFLTDVAPRVKAAILRLEADHPTSPPPQALAAREFAASQLSDESLGCYWYSVLRAYAGLYFTESGAQVPQQVQLGDRNTTLNPTL